MLAGQNSKDYYKRPSEVIRIKVHVDRCDPVVSMPNVHSEYVAGRDGLFGHC